MIGKYRVERFKIIQFAVCLFCAEIHSNSIRSNISGSLKGTTSPQKSILEGIGDNRIFFEDVLFSEDLFIKVSACILEDEGR
jgi:hypothetical protein